MIFLVKIRQINNRSGMTYMTNDFVRITLKSDGKLVGTASAK